jgi:hypothetical protein
MVLAAAQEDHRAMVRLEREVEALRRQLDHKEPECGHATPKPALTE